MYENTDLQPRLDYNVKNFTYNGNPATTNTVLGIEEFAIKGCSHGAIATAICFSQLMRSVEYHFLCRSRKM